MAISTPSSTISPEKLTLAVKAEARRLGFTAVGIAGPEAFEEPHRRLAAWIAQGRQGQMHYLTQFLERHTRFRESLPGLASLIVVAASYAGLAPQPPPSGPVGRVARYAAGRDYHRVLQRRLKLLSRTLEPLAGRPVTVRACVDTAPLHERSLAAAAGLGFIGKNTCLILPKGGSWIVLGLLATDLELMPDAPITHTCGACTRCLEACPTGALAAPYEMDARRCIAYLTLEHRGPIPEALRPQIGSWVAGCDICQEVCPYNAQPAPAAWAELTASAGVGQGISLEAILRLPNQAAFDAQFTGTALRRPTYAGMVRNAAIAAGNAGDRRLVPLLQDRAGDPDPIIRDAAQWALHEISR